jgi:radical SAM/Cys-rich protein
MASTLPSLVSRQLPLASSCEQLATLRRLPLAREFPEALDESGLNPLRPTGIEILQINVGKLCNQTCAHCHVDAGPDRREIMSRETMAQCVEALKRTAIPTVDVTGGAPELNPRFRWLVEQCAGLGRHVIDRCNLTVLGLPSQADLADFLAAQRVEVVCSLPHYRQLNTDRQRGDGVFDKSIAGLRKLNALGYGDDASGLRLVLVTNPVGAYLPAGQASLEREWKRELDRLYGIRFNALHTITNMPISRFLEWLVDSSNLERYMERLVTSYNPAAARGVMCRNMLSVGWDGVLYDCDFNQMAAIPAANEPRTLWSIDSLDNFNQGPIALADHCYGCTAGSGSSCAGQLM